MRKIGIDYGLTRIGIAVSDPTGIIASPREVYERATELEDLAYIRALIRREEADAVIFGLPLNMDGTESNMSRLVRTFAGQLKADVKIHFFDERWSSVQSQRYLDDLNSGDRKDRRAADAKKRQAVDKIAAQIILQAFLDSEK